MMVRRRTTTTMTMTVVVTVAGVERQTKELEDQWVRQGLYGKGIL